MLITPFTNLSANCAGDACRGGWLPAWIDGLRAARRERLRASRLARRERLRMGYKHIPQRVWDRRSALFLER